MSAPTINQIGYASHLSGGGTTYTLGPGFNFPVEAGDQLVMFIATENGTAVSSNAAVESVTDNFGNIWEQVPNAHGSNQNVSAELYLDMDVWTCTANANIPASSAGPVLNITITFSIVDVYAYICVFDVSASQVATAGATASSPTNPFDGPSLTSSGPALFLTALNAGDSDPYLYTSLQSPWELQLNGAGQAGVALIGGYLSEASAATEQPIWSSEINFVTSPGLVSSAVVMTAQSAPPSGGSLPFLGSVRVVANAPSGMASPFLGTVKVLEAAPSNVPNPYLGTVVSVGSAPGTVPNPTIGEVVLVESAPSGVPEQFIGEIIES
jgi:hypothetical protein